MRITLLVHEWLHYVVAVHIFMYYCVRNNDVGSCNVHRRQTDIFVARGACRSFERSRASPLVLCARSTQPACPSGSSSRAEYRSNIYNPRDPKKYHVILILYSTFRVFCCTIYPLWNDTTFLCSIIYIVIIMTRVRGGDGDANTTYRYILCVYHIILRRSRFISAT